MAELPQLITARLADVRALCAKYHVRQLSIFGSAVKGTFDPERSDLDFVVEFERTTAGRHADSYFGLLLGLQDLFGRDVDLVERSAVDNPYFLEVLRMTEQPLYDAA